MKNKRITLTRETKTYLLKILKQGYIDRDELNCVLDLGLQPSVINVTVVSTGVPFASCEEDIID